MLKLLFLIYLGTLFPFIAGPYIGHTFFYGCCLVSTSARNVEPSVTHHIGGW